MPAPHSIELQGLREAQRDAERMVREMNGTPILTAMRSATMLVSGTAKREAKVDTGRYRSSITPAISVAGNIVEGIVGSNLAYAPSVVLDTKPHWPPISEIRAWVHRKRMAGRYSTKTRRRLGTAYEHYWEDFEIAWIIARKIARKGTKGDRSLMLGIEKNAGRIFRLFERAVDQVIRG